jgi:hypothetical protein
LSVSPVARGHLCGKGDTNALIDETQAEETDRRPGDGARELNVLLVALDFVIPAHVAGTKVLVVAPALNSWLRRWLSDEDGARRRAGERAAAVADCLAQSGAHVEGRAGDGDPLLAIAGALSTFPADEILIAAQPGRSSQIAEELGSRARARFALPTFRAGESLSKAA